MTGSTIFEFIESFFYEVMYAPLVIQIAVVFIIIAVSCTLLAYGSILRRRIKGSRRDKRRAALNIIIDDLLVEHVLTKDDTEDPAIAAAEAAQAFDMPIFHKRWTRQALIDRLISFRNNVRGSMGELLRLLYLQMELDKDTFRKLKSSKWTNKVRALAELTSMNISVADVTILPLTNSRNLELRAAARHAYIKLSKNEPFKFFDLATDPLLMWDQIELFKIITTTDHISIPNFGQWITYSPNKSIVSFCLKLIVHYNQLSALPAVMKLLDTKDHYLRADAINCLGKLKVEDVEDKLVHIYNNQPLICQIEILKAIGRISSGRYIEFLKAEFLHSTDFDLRKNAAKSLINNSWAANDIVNELVETATSENRLILKHCMNPLIKF